MGGLPNVYTGYQKVDDPQVREKFASAWRHQLPEKPGMVMGTMFEAAAHGQVKAMYIVGENPVLSDPDSHHVETALQELDFLVVQDIFLTETARLADVVLPGASFAEKDGTFSNTERRVQRIRQAVKPVGDARADWWIIAEIGRRMGVGMDYADPEAVFNELRQLTPSYAGITYQRLQAGGLQWPCPSENHPGTPILHTTSFSRGKGLLIAVEQVDPFETRDRDYPLLLTTGRRLKHYHTGTMTRRAAALNQGRSEDYLEINPVDARQLAIVDDNLVLVKSRRGEVKIKARVTDMVPTGTVFTSFHFWESAINRLTVPQTDALSGTPQLKVCAVRVEKL